MQRTAVLVVFLTFLVAVGDVPAQVPQSDLIAEYLFGGNAKDTAGGGFDGVVHGASLTTDRFGNADSAFSFDGVDDYIDLGAVIPVVELSSHGTGTISLWFKASSDTVKQGKLFVASGVHGNPVIDIGDTTLYSHEESISWAMGSFGHPSQENGHRYYMDDQWHLVTVVMGSDFNLIYVDGEPVSVRYLGSTPSSPDVGGLLWVGAIDYIVLGGRIPYYLGALDDVRIYGRALTDEEVQQLFDEIPPARFSCAGFQPPMATGTVTARGNRALPLKAELFDVSGHELTDLELTAPPVMQVTFESATGGDPIDVTDDALPAGLGTEGNEFEYNLADGAWLYKLKTKGYTAAGTYTITMVSGDDSEYIIDPTCEASFGRIE